MSTPLAQDSITPQGNVAATTSRADSEYHPRRVRSRVSTTLANTVIDGHAVAGDDVPAVKR